MVKRENKIGVGVITYNREEQFTQIIKSLDIDVIDHIVAVKDGGKLSYDVPDATYHMVELDENSGVATCKNIAIEHLLTLGCDHIFILEDDCLVVNNDIWEYCISFSQDSGLLHFNWNDYRSTKFATLSFKKHLASLCHDTEANFSYFHKTFLQKIRFDQEYINAWEHIDIELQGEKQGFLPPFRYFVCPLDMGNYLKLIDKGESTITGKSQYQQRVSLGHEHFRKKWGKSVSEIIPPPFDDFYNSMKNITKKYARRE